MMTKITDEIDEIHPFCLSYKKRFLIWAQFFKDFTVYIMTKNTTKQYHLHLGSKVIC